MNIEEKIEKIFPVEESIPLEFILHSPVNQNEYLINGVLHVWKGAMQYVYSPVCLKTDSGTEPKLIGHYPLLTEIQAMEALESSVKAYDQGRGVWPNMSISERIRHMENFIQKMITKKKEIVILLMWEIGKSFIDSQKEFERTIEYMTDTINSLKELEHSSSKFISEQGIIAQIRRVSLGTVLCRGPFNYPLNETFTTLIPAIIMGNTVVFKPPKYGVLLHYPLLKLFQECFPPGVVNTVYGQGHKVIPPMMASGKVDVLALIGSSKVADSLTKQHPRSHKLRCIFGLDAKNPAIILPDADLELTVKECVLGTLSFNGQRCTALKILFVHSQIIDIFLNKLSEAVSQLNYGMPWENGVNITPLPEPEKPGYLSELIEEAKTMGAKVINESGGKVNKTFVYPAILYPVNSKMRIYHEEQFGPVIPVVSFENIHEPIQYIVDSNFGQQVSIFGKDPDLISELIDPLINQVSRVNINSQCQRGPDVFPFTGRKDSAETTLSITDALRAFSIRTMVAAKGSETNKEIITNIVNGHRSKFLSTDFIL